MPIDAYIPSSAEARDLARAQAKALKPCMSAAGFAPTADAEAAAGESEDRRFGLWNVERARLYGFSLKGEDAHHDSDPSPERDEAYDRCSQDASDATHRFDVPSITDPDGTHATAVRDEASALLRQDPLWPRLKKEFDGCLRSHGLTPQSDGWGSTESDDLLTGGTEAGGTAGGDARAEEIRIAVVEAQCNTDLDITQQLSDREAGYQATLIEDNEADLAAEQKKKDEAVAAARAFLAGG